MAKKQAIRDQAELAEINRRLAEADVARREYEHLTRRREEMANRAVRNEARRQRFLARLDADIAEAGARLDAALAALEA